LLGRFAKHLFTLTESAPENLQRKFIVYFFQRAKLDKFTINELIESISSPLKEAIMSTADIFRTEGKKEGIEQGIQRGMERGIQHGIERGIQIGRKEKLDKSILNMLARGIPTDTICEVLEVNPEYVAQIQNGMTSQ
jgi:flagellar biosynthesis/type III secretory pathway protein FliH